MRPDTVVGRSADTALKSSLFYGILGQADYIIDRILEETGVVKCTIVATDGFVQQIEQFSHRVKSIKPTLTLEVLRLIGEGG